MNEQQTPTSREPTAVASTPGLLRATEVGEVLASAPGSFKALLEAARDMMTTLEHLVTDCGEGKHKDGFCCYSHGGDRTARVELGAAIAAAEGRAP